MNKFRNILIILCFLFVSSGVLAQNQALMRSAFLLHQGNASKSTMALVEVDPNTLNATDKAIYYEFLGLSAYMDNNHDVSENAWLERIAYDNPGQGFLYLAKISFEKKNHPQAYNYLTKHLNSLDRLPYQQIVQDKVFDEYVRDREWIRFWSNFNHTKRDDAISTLHSALAEPEYSESSASSILSEFGSDAEVLLLVAENYINQNEVGLAKELLTKTIEFPNNRYSILSKLGMLYINLGEFDSAILAFQRSLEIFPYQPEIWMKRIECLSKLGRDSEAREVMVFLNSFGVQNPDLWMSLALQSSETSIDKALELVNQVIEQDPLNVAGFNLRAKLMLDIGDSENSIYSLNQSLDIDPTQADIYFLRAQTRYDLGDEEGACHDWKKALRYGHRKAMDKLYKYCSYLPI